MVLIRGV
jgi:hypothetical protein